MKKLNNWILIGFVLLFCFSSKVLAYSGTNVYRLYNPNTNEHLYSPSVEEQRALVQNGWTYEGTGWVESYGGDGVYRLYNPNTGFHLYTQDKNEVNILKEKGWSVDNNGNFIFVSSGPVPIYRLYNPYIFQHLLTTDENEYKSLGLQGWNQEGIALEGMLPGNNNPINLNLTIAPGSPNIQLTNKTYQILSVNQLGYYNVLFGEYSTGDSNILTIPYIGEDKFMIQMKDQYPYYTTGFEITYDDYRTFQPINKNILLQFFYGD